jgi:hypothetical protein
MGHGGNLAGADEALADLPHIMKNLNLELGALAWGKAA